MVDFEKLLISAEDGYTLMCTSLCNSNQEENKKQREIYHSNISLCSGCVGATGCILKNVIRETLTFLVDVNEVTGGGINAHVVVPSLFVLAEHLLGEGGGNNENSK